MAWIFCQRTLQTDVLSVESAAAAMNGMRQDYIFYKRAWEDNSQSPMWAYMHEYFVKRYTEIAGERSGVELGRPDHVQHPPLLLRHSRHDAGMADERQHRAGENRRANDV